MRHATLIAVLSYSCCLLAADKPPADSCSKVTPSRFEYVEQGIYVPVVLTSLDGQREVEEFLLDTGSSGTTVSLAAADRLRLQPFGSTLNRTPGGSAIRYTAKVASISGLHSSLATTDMQVLVDDLLPLSTARQRKVDGILGVDFLQDQILTIDFIAKRLWLFPKECIPSNVDPVPLTFYRGMLFVSAELHNGKKVSLLLDTGSGGQTDFVVYSQPEIGDFKPNAPITALTLNAGPNSYDVDVGPVPWFKLGDITIKNAMGALVKHALLTGFAYGHCVGMIGPYAFEPGSVSIDFSRHMLYLPK